MKDDLRIQWFPGHMTKTKRLIEADIKIVDAVAELVDARCPEASRNPILDEIIQNKPRIIILNKSDYADTNVTALWKRFYEKKGFAVLICDCRSGNGVKNFAPLLKKLLAQKLESRESKGMIGKALRVMVVGIPNVGKSSFINRMANSKKTQVGDRPGVTRGKQWVTIDKQIELLDMPGILWPKFEDKNAAMLLGFTGAIKDDVIDILSLANELGELLIKNYPNMIIERYKLKSLDGNILENIASARGMLISKGELDTERAASTLLDEFRGGKIGKISLEKPNGV